MDAGRAPCDTDPMRRATMTAAGLACGLALACGATQRWHLLHPPESLDPDAPGGIRLLPRTPMAEWRIAGTYAGRDECLAARDAAWDENLGRARAAVGDDAKYDVGVRRAVQARCVRAPHR